MSSAQRWARAVSQWANHGAGGGWGYPNSRRSLSVLWGVLWLLLLNPISHFYLSQRTSWLLACCPHYLAALLMLIIFEGGICRVFYLSSPLCTSTLTPIPLPHMKPFGHGFTCSLEAPLPPGSYLILLEGFLGTFQYWLFSGVPEWLYENIILLYCHGWWVLDLRGRGKGPRKLWSRNHITEETGSKLGKRSCPDKPEW